MTRIDYYQFVQFQDVYLEDSLVLSVSIDSNIVEFNLLCVLNESHKLYIPPPPNEQYCYRDACILFPNLKSANWIKKSMIPYKDVDGKIDYGNIDMLFLSDGHYHISGDWGELDIVSDSPVIEFLG